MKKLFAIAVFLFVAACQPGNPETIYPAPVQPVDSEVISNHQTPIHAVETSSGEVHQQNKLTEKEACSTGVWRDFSNGCRDYCYPGKGPRMCTMVYGPGCDCGPTQCFDRQEMKCVDNPQG